MDTNQNQGSFIDPNVVAEVQQEHITNLVHENILMGAAMRQQQREIESLQEMLRQASKPAENEPEDGEGGPPE